MNKIQTKAPLLSVVVPVYNTEQYLEKSLNSLLTSTFNDLEIIIIDDGSTDDSPRICDEFQARNPHWDITVVHNTNAGLSTVRNLGLSMARGKYITYCDSDDWIEPEIFAALIKAAEENNVQAAICRIKYFDDSTGQTEYFTDSLFPKKLANKVFNYQDCHAVIKGLLDCSTCNKVFLRSFMQEHQFHYEEKCDFGEDNRFWADYFLTASRLILIDRPLYNYRINQSRQTNSIKVRKHYDSFAETLNIIRGVFEKHRVYSQFQGEVIAYFALQISAAFGNVSQQRKKAFFYECKEIMLRCGSFCYSREVSIPMRIIIAYIYVVFRMFPYYLGNIALLPLQILRSSPVKKIIKKIAG